MNILQVMDRKSLKKLLDNVQSGTVSPDDALDQLRDFPVAQIEGASLDMHRQLRRGFPEVVQMHDSCARVVVHESRGRLQSVRH